MNSRSPSDPDAQAAPVVKPLSVDGYRKWTSELPWTVEQVTLLRRGLDPDSLVGLADPWEDPWTEGNEVLIELREACSEALLAAWSGAFNATRADNTSGHDVCGGDDWLVDPVEYLRWSVENVRVRMPRPLRDFMKSGGQLKAAAPRVQLTDDEVAVINAMQQAGVVLKHGEIARHAILTHGPTNRALNGLKELGLVTHRGKRGGYSLTPLGSSWSLEGPCGDASDPNS
jgi:hypothetical protein